jgi:hypothetical protein
MAKDPRIVELICVSTGNRFALKDDGASLTSDGTFPNGHRQQIIRKATEQYKLGKRSGKGPVFNAWVVEKRLERASGDPKKDPAMLFKTLDDRETIDIDGELKSMTYREIMAMAIAKNKADDSAHLALVEAEARQKGASKEMLDKIAAEVKELKEAVKADDAEAPAKVKK